VALGPSGVGVSSMALSVAVPQRPTFTSRMPPAEDDASYPQLPQISPRSAQELADAAAWPSHAAPPSDWSPRSPRRPFQANQDSTADDAAGGASPHRLHQLPQITPRSEQVSLRAEQASSKNWGERAVQSWAPKVAPQISTPRDATDWASQTFGYMGSARALRTALQSEIHASTTARVDPLTIPRTCGNNTTTLEERLKKREMTEKKISDTLYGRLSKMEENLTKVIKCCAELNRVTAKTWASLNVAEKRLEIRATRPPQEQVQDVLQDALEQELKDLSPSHKELTDWLKSGQEVHKSMEGAIAEMNDQRLTLHLDRTNFPKEFLDRMRRVDEAAHRFCGEVAPSLRKAQGILAQSQKRSAAAAKRRLAELQQMRLHLEEELTENENAINSAQKQLAKWDQQIADHESRPELTFKNPDGDDVDFATFWSNSKLSMDALRKLQAGVKSASYVGHDGRKLDVLFKRADRDGSGELDEQEIRRVLRCTLKIAPTVIADCEISALCETLDTDRSGAVSITELVYFLNADVDIETTKVQYTKIKEILDQLHATHAELLADLRGKRQTILVDKACSQVSESAAFELDTNLDQKSQAQGPRRRKPLEPRMVDKVRAKLQRATSQKDVLEIFTKFDKDSSGQLEDSEFRRAVRESLGIAKYSISDAEISSLCGMLDADGSGSVSIAEIAEFIDSGPQVNAAASAVVGSARAIDSDTQRLKPGMRRQDMKVGTSKKQGATSTVIN